MVITIIKTLLLKFFNKKINICQEKLSFPLTKNRIKQFQLRNYFFAIFLTVPIIPNTPVSKSTTNTIIIVSTNSVTINPAFDAIPAINCPTISNINGARSVLVYTGV